MSSSIRTTAFFCDDIIAVHQTECFCALRNITPALIIRSRVLIIIIFFMLVSNYWLITVFFLQAS